MSRKWRNWCQNEVYEERKEADSRDKVKHNGRSDQLFLEMTSTVDLSKEVGIQSAGDDLVGSVRSSRATSSIVTSVSSSSEVGSCLGTG